MFQEDLTELVDKQPQFFGLLSALLLAVVCVCECGPAAAYAAQAELYH